MKLRCYRCKSTFQGSIKNLIGSFYSQKHCLCEQCNVLYNYENSSGLNWAVLPTNFDEHQCTVGQYVPKLYDWFERQLRKCCAIKLKDDTCLIAHIDTFDKGKLVLSTDSGRRLHKLITDISEVVLVNSDAERRRYVDTSDEIIGYKGILVRRGILDADGYIYELNIPYEEKKRDPFATDFQDVYSHFCISIEDVLIHWRDCITQSIKNAENGTHYDELRLFRVRAKGHCFQNTPIGWVSNDLTILSEVTQTEIIEYFIKHPDSKDRVFRKLELDETMSNLWERYQKIVVIPYSNTLSVQEIIKLFALDYPDCKAESCTIFDSYAKRSLCTCYAKLLKDAHFAYLMTRKEIQDGIFSYDSIAYSALKATNRKPFLESIHRLIVESHRPV